MLNMASNSTNNKRRRTAADTLHISDLPTGFIVDVSAYLTKPSRALLAVALSAPSASWKDDDLIHRQSPISTAIISSEQWDILDFEDVNKEIANKMTDDDIYAVLTCINARDVLKRLKLCGCINVEGHGLNPLRGSVVLEQIDLCIVKKHEVPKSEPEPKISQYVVVPILDSIISVNGCSLKYIQIPVKWRYMFAHDRSGVVYPIWDFKRRFNENLSNRRIECSRCVMFGAMHAQHTWLNDVYENERICYDCLEPICYYCRFNSGDVSVHCCSNGCSKTFCDNCMPLMECSYCATGAICGACGDMEACGQCGNASCENCLNSCDGCLQTRCTDCSEYNCCEGYECIKAHCSDCYNGEEYSVKYCDECESSYCSGCKLDVIMTNGVKCNGCAGDAANLLLEEVAKLRIEKEELMELRKENEELKEKLKQT